MAKSLHDQLVEVAPIMQVVLALGSGFALAAGALPEREFERALGLDPRLPDGVSVAYSDYGALAHFLAGLFEAVLREPLAMFVLFGLLLLGAWAFLVAHEDSGLVARGEAPAHPRMHSRPVAWCLLLAFSTLFVSQVATYPWFAAPQRLTNLASHLEAPEDFDGEGWPDARIERWHGQLYAAFFGMPRNAGPGTSADFSPVRHHVPNQDDFDYLFRYYGGLAAWTIWTLVLVASLTLIGATVARRAPSRRRQCTIGAAIIVVTFVHVLQWTHLAHAYGRLHLPALVLQRAAHALARAEIQPEPTQWPFNEPAFLTNAAKERLTIDYDVLAIRNYWPIRKDEGADTAVLSVGCNPVHLRKHEHSWTQRDASRARSLADGVIVFEGISLQDLRRLCEEGDESLWIWDLYSEPSEVRLQTLKAALGEPD